MDFDMAINNPIRLGMEEEALSAKVEAFCRHIYAKYGNHLSKEDFYYEYSLNGFKEYDNLKMTPWDIQKLDQFDLY